MDILKKLFELKDEKYANFQSALVPNINTDSIIGVRIPDIRALAKKCIKDPDIGQFLVSLPHAYYEENILHAIIIDITKNYTNCIDMLAAFLPYVNNWAVCDTISPDVFKKHKSELLPRIFEWIDSDHTFTRRFGIKMLMSYYLDDDFDVKYSEKVCSVESDEYYVNMMVAWYFATALAKQWNSTVTYIENHRLPQWTHNKTIRKAVESYRLTDEKKAYLKSLKK